MDVVKAVGVRSKEEIRDRTTKNRTFTGKRQGQFIFAEIGMFTISGADLFQIMKNLLFLVPILVVLGCTSVTVRQPDPQLHLSHVLIRNNPKVIVEGFVEVMRDGFDRHGISSEIIPEGAKAKSGD